MQFLTVLVNTDDARIPSQSTLIVQYKKKKKVGLRLDGDRSNPKVSKYHKDVLVESIIGQ